MKQKRDSILMINYAFPPRISIGSLRNYYISKEFAKLFKTVNLLTSNNFKNDDNHMSLTHIASKKNLFTFDIFTIKKLFKDKKTKKQKSNLSKGNNSSLLQKMSNSFPFNVLFFYGGFFYLIHGIFKGLAIAEKNTVVISSFRPLVDHIIGFIIKTFKKDVFWIAEYRDVYSFPSHNDVLFPKFQDYIHKKIMTKADLIVVVSDGHKNYFKRYTNSLFVVRNGLPNTDKINQKITEREKFTIVYTGKLYNGKRDPSILFIALNNLINNHKIDKDKIEIIYAGTEGKTWMEYSQKYKLASTNLGLISHQESMELQRTAHINLLMNWNEPELKGGLSGKLYEYINSERPILLILNGDKDEEFELIFNDLNLGLVAYDETKHIPNIENFIIDLYQYYKTEKKAKIIIKQENVYKYEWPNLVNNLIKHIK